MPGIVVSTADYATVGIRGCSLVLLCFFLLFYMFHKCTPTASCFDPSMQINIPKFEIPQQTTKAAIINSKEYVQWER